MTKEELLRELDKIHCYCSHMECDNCIFSYGEYLTCFFLSTPDKWNIEAIYKYTEAQETFRNYIIDKFMERE